MDNSPIQQIEKEQFREVIIKDSGEKIIYTQEVQAMFTYLIQKMLQIEQAKKICIVIDQEVENLYNIRKYEDQFKIYGFETVYIFIQARETQKNNNCVDKIHTIMFEQLFSRKDILIAVGGGLTTDIAAYAASIYMRGINYILVPTTLLAIVDASYGGKTGINNDYGKNLIGTFSKPLAIINCTEFYYTLDQRQFSNGFAEIIKAATIHDAEFFNFLKQFNIGYLMDKQNSEILEQIIEKSLNIKISVVLQDRYEKNLREILNFGHTLGHGIEMDSKDKLLHGECVSIGMILASKLALQIAQNENQKPKELEQSEIKTYIIELEDILKKYELPTKIPPFIDIPNVIEYTKHDKKVIQGQIRFILLKQIGKTVNQAIPVDIEQVEKLLFKQIFLTVGKNYNANNQEMINSHIPGSKSITNRCLLMAAIGNGKITLDNFHLSDDIQAMLRSLKSLGFLNILQQNESSITLEGSQLQQKLQNSTQLIHIDLGESGTTARFILPLVMLQRIPVKLEGGPSLSSRPMKDLIDALNLHGNIQFLNKEYFLPFIVVPNKGIQGGQIKIKSKTSSQFVSAILMVAPAAQNEVFMELEDVNEDDEVVSESFIIMTITLMEKFGIQVKRVSKNVFMIPKGIYQNPTQFFIEPDVTSSTYDLAHVVMNGGCLKLIGISENSCQGDYQFLNVLKNMGVQIKTEEYDTIVSHKQGIQLKPIKINCNQMTDTFITLAVLVSTLPGIHKITGISNQRVKECNRIQAMVKNLNKCGIISKELEDGIKIIGVEITSFPFRKNVLIKTYDDHRIAMAFSILGFFYEKKNYKVKIIIENKDCVQKTFPNFWNHIYKNFGIDYIGYHQDRKLQFLARFQFIKDPLIIIGMRGAGKTNLAKYLSEKLNWSYISIDEQITDHLKKHHQFKSINEAVETKGWVLFRKIEKKIIFRLISGIKLMNPHTVIDCGGGILENSETFSLIKSQENVIYIEKSLSDIEQDSNHTKRPQLHNNLSFSEIYQQRKTNYLKAASYIYTIPPRTEVFKNNRNLHLESYFKTISKPFIKFAKKILNLEFPTLPILHTPTFFACSFIEDIDQLSERDFLIINKDYHALEIRLDKLVFVEDNAQQIAEEIRFRISKIKIWSKIPLIITLRSKPHGGFFQYDSNNPAHLNFLNSFLNYLSKYCLHDLFDLELDFLNTKTGVNLLKKWNRKSVQIRVILSKHYVDQLNLSQQEIMEDINIMKKLYNDFSGLTQLLKVAVHEKCMHPSLVYSIINQPQNFMSQNAPIPYLVLGMGQQAQLYRLQNDYMTPLALFGQTAQGQQNMNKYKTIYELINIPIHQGNYHLFGSPVYRSPSHIMHQNLFDILNGEHNYYYDKIEIKKIEEVEPYLQDKFFKGASITIPIKQEISKYVHKHSIEVEIIGGVINTIVKYKGFIYGFNTDWWGIYHPIAKHLKYFSSQATCIIVGNGATAKTAFFVAHNLFHLRIIVYGRNLERINNFIEECGQSSVIGCDSSEELLKQDLSQIALIISTIPPNSQMQYPEEILLNKPIILIANYNLQDPILIQGKNRGSVILTGYDMIIYQALGQIQLYNGKKLNEVHKLKDLQKELQK